VDKVHTVRNLNVLLSMLLTSPTGVPSCFTPVTQHFCMGPDAILLIIEVLNRKKFDCWDGAN
jgi:hypothetical protein